MFELIIASVKLILLVGGLFLFLGIVLAKAASAGKETGTGRTVAATSGAGFGEEEKEGIRRAYEILKNIAEMSKQHPINGRYMQVFIDDSKRNDYFVNFDISIAYEYETSFLKQLRNTAEKEREFVLYDLFRDTSYEKGADHIHNIKFGEYGTIEFSVPGVIGKRVTRHQIIEEFKAMGIYDVSGGKSYTSFCMYQ